MVWLNSGYPRIIFLGYPPTTAFSGKVSVKRASYDYSLTSVKFLHLNYNFFRY